MRTVATLNVLLRSRVELTEGLILGAEEFREGWNFLRSVGVGSLEKTILNHAWSFIKIDGGAQTSGVGNTSQEAIASALKLALRDISEHFNAVEVEYSELTKYPWFFLARLRINPYRIQQGAVEPVSDDAGPLPNVLRPKRLPRQSAVLYPHPGSAMPMLKEILILSRSTHERTQ